MIKRTDSCFFKCPSWRIIKNKQNKTNPRFSIAIKKMENSFFIQQLLHEEFLGLANLSCEELHISEYNNFMLG